MVYYINDDINIFFQNLERNLVEIFKKSLIFSLDCNNPHHGEPSNSLTWFETTIISTSRKSDVIHIILVQAQVLGTITESTNC